MSGSLGTAQQYLDKGLAFYNKGWLDEAISSYRMAIDMRGGNFARASYQLARALLDAGDVDGAIEAFQTSITNQPENPDAYYSLGLTLARRGEHADAITAYRKAIELNPKYSSAHDNLSNLLRQLGRE